MKSACPCSTSDPGALVAFRDLDVKVEYLTLDMTCWLHSLGQLSMQLGSPFHSACLFMNTVISWIGGTKEVLGRKAFSHLQWISVPEKKVTFVLQGKHFFSSFHIISATNTM